MAPAACAGHPYHGAGCPNLRQSHHIPGWRVIGRQAPGKVPPSRPGGEFWAKGADTRQKLDADALRVDFPVRIGQRVTIVINDLHTKWGPAGHASQLLKWGLSCGAVAAEPGSRTAFVAGARLARHPHSRLRPRSGTGPPAPGCAVDRGGVVFALRASLPTAQCLGCLPAPGRGHALVSRSCQSDGASPNLDLARGQSGAVSVAHSPADHRLERRSSRVAGRARTAIQRRPRGSVTLNSPTMTSRSACLA